VPNAAIFNPGKKFDWGRFWSCARQPLLSHKHVSRNQQNNAINCNFHEAWSKHLYWLPLKLKFTFSSQNRYQKFSWRMACLGPYPWGRQGEKVSCPKEKSTCPGRPDGGFFEPWFSSFFLLLLLFDTSGERKYMLFACWKVCIGRNCGRGLENFHFQVQGHSFSLYRQTLSSK